MIRGRRVVSNVVSDRAAVLFAARRLGRAGLTAALAFAVGWAGPAHAAPPGAEDIVRVELISETESVAAGETIHLGASFSIAPEWHIYWKNSGDTGMPISLDLTAPPGFEVGEPQWPTPRRYEHTGLLDYVYEKRVTLIIPVRVPADLSPGDEVRFQLAAQWLMCKSVCLPGDGESSLTLRVRAAGTDAERSEDASLIQASRRRLPQPWRPGDGSGLRAAWRDGALAIEAPGASRLTFFPLTPDAAQPVNIMEAGDVRGAATLIRYDDRVADAPRVSGVVEIARDGRTRRYLIEVERS